MLGDAEFLFSCSTRYLIRLLCLLLRHRVKHSKSNSISPRSLVLFSLYQWAISEFTSVFIHIEIGTSYDKNFALRLALEVRLRETRKWPIDAFSAPSAGVLIHFPFIPVFVCFFFVVSLGKLLKWRPVKQNRAQFTTTSTQQVISVTKGLAKLGNIVADANVSQFSRAGNMCCENKFCCSETKNIFAWSQKHFCFPDTNFASETYVSQFSHPGKHNKKHCFRNNVS